ncbi:MAG: hypothetical protein NC293_10965 [Roseburia sp.]|nr:hypothetical protein [Roseburia sp.]
MKRDELTDKIKEIIQSAGPVKITIMILCGVLLLLISCSGLFEKEEVGEEERATVQKENEPGDDLQIYKNTMEEQVRSILEKVDGVGEVDVMITLRASKEKVTLKDNTVEEKRREEETVLIQDENDNTSPYVIREVEPQIEGILIVCDGGNRAAVQREIIDGISALFSVESHKIKVMKSKEAK